MISQACETLGRFTGLTQEIPQSSRRESPPLPTCRALSSRRLIFPRKENCILVIDKSTLKIISELSRQPGSSTKNLVVGKLRWLPKMGLIVGNSVTCDAFGYSGYIRLWDPRSNEVIWEVNEPGSGRTSRFGDSFVDVDADVEESTLFKLCSKSGDLAVVDLRKLGDDPWVYLQDKNPSLRNAGGDGTSGSTNSVVRCYRKQVFVGRECGLEVWSRVAEAESRVERENGVCEGWYRRNFVDKEEDSERGVIKKIEGGETGCLLFAKMLRVLRCGKALILPVRFRCCDSNEGSVISNVFTILLLFHIFGMLASRYIVSDFI